MLAYCPVMPPRIVVDADDLDFLSEVLAQTKVELEQLGPRLSVYEAALGSDRVRRGVHRVISNWSDVREKILSELDAVAGLLHEAAGDYRALEQRIIADAAGDPPVFPDID